MSPAGAGRDGRTVVLVVALGALLVLLGLLVADLTTFQPAGRAVLAVLPVVVLALAAVRGRADGTVPAGLGVVAVAVLGGADQLTLVLLGALLLLVLGALAPDPGLRPGRRLAAGAGVAAAGAVLVVLLALVAGGSGALPAPAVVLAAVALAAAPLLAVRSLAQDLGSDPEREATDAGPP